MFSFHSAFSYRTDIPDNSIVALGCFDGVHRGHTELLRKTRQRADEMGAAAVALSFAEPPAFVLRPGSEQLLTDTEERSRLFREAGLDAAYFVRFEDLRDLSPDSFIRDILCKELRATGVVCGYNFTFGRDRKGTPDTLRSYFGERVFVCPPVEMDGAPVSSSRIRALIREGKVKEAAALLGRPYSFEGTGAHGRGDGTKFGFPTANIIPAAGRALPAPGVYLSAVEIPGEGPFPAVTDAGFAPTVDKSGIFRLETHILGYSTDLHGKPLRVSLLDFRRPEKHFSDPQELVSAISADVSAAQKYFENNPLT